MKETHKSRAAFEDYYEMGPERSLQKLFDNYQARSKHGPTRHLSTLKKWSGAHGWQDRVVARDRELADAVMDALKETAVSTGYSIFQKRIAGLNSLAEHLFSSLTASGTVNNYLPAVKEFRGLLADIAAEMGERRTHHRIEIDIDRKLIELIDEHGLTYSDIRSDPLLAMLFENSGHHILGILKEAQNDDSLTGEEDMNGSSNQD